MVISQSGRVSGEIRLHSEQLIDNGVNLRFEKDTETANGDLSDESQRLTEKMFRKAAALLSQSKRQCAQTTRGDEEQPGKLRQPRQG